MCLKPAKRVVYVHVNLLVVAQATNIHEGGRSYKELNRETLQWDTVRLG